jgi:hypothetical protein
MLRNACLLLASLLLLALGSACSSTTVTGSWKNPDYTGTVRKVYVVGIVKQELTRRMFEDEFVRQLQSYGVNGIASYKDLFDVQQAGKEQVGERVSKNGADSVLMTRIFAKRTEEVVNPGRISSYETGPYYGYPRAYAPDPYYRNWGSYYDRSFATIYEPPSVTRFEVVTVEANLYDAKSGELIWAAQLDTVVEGNTQKMITDFIETVSKDLRQNGLL